MINYHLLNNSLTLHFNGEHHIIKKGDHRFNPIINAIKENNLEKIPNLIENNFFGNKLNGLIYDKEKDDLFFEGKPLADGLKKKIFGLLKENLPLDRFIKFAKKLAKNPSYRSRKMLYKFLEHNGHPLTEDGNFIAYRGCSSNFRDRYSGKFDNSVGSICEMSRENVDDDPSNTCSTGLHVAAYDYAYNWGPITLIVEVNPSDVVTVPYDYNGTKMRVCKFKVLEICNKRLENEGAYETEIYEENSDDFNWNF